MRHASRDEIARGAGLSVLIIVAGNGASYVVQVLLARMLGPADFGTYAYAVACLNMLQTFAALDLSGAALRFGGMYASQKAFPLLRGFIHRSRLIVLLASLVVGAVGALFLTRIRPAQDPSRQLALLWICVGTLPAALLALELNILQAIGRTVAARVPMQILRPLVILLVAVGVTLVAPPLTAVHAVAANITGLTVAAAVSLWWTHRVRPRETHDVPAQYETAAWVQMSLATLTGSVLQMILSQQADIIIVGTVVNSRAAGLYGVAGQLATIVTLGVTTVNHYAAPLLAAHGRDVRSPELRHVIRRISLINWVVSLPLALVLLIGGPWILGIFGPAFREAYPTLCLLVVSQVILAGWSALAGTMLTATGRYRSATFVIGAAAALNLALTMVLTPRYGIVGAAAATCGAVVFRALAMLLLVHREIGVWMIPTFSRRRLAEKLT